MFKNILILNQLVRITMKKVPNNRWCWSKPYMEISFRCTRTAQLSECIERISMGKFRGSFWKDGEYILK